MSERTRDIYWRPWQEPGLEHLHLSVTADGARALGLILCMREQAHLRCRYELEADSAWRTRRLAFAVMPSGGGEAERLVLEADGDGTWMANGERRADLDGCIDVDVQITPFTNTLPIRRLGLALEEGADIRVAYVPVPGLAVRAVEQRYTCLEPLNEAGGRYRYDGLFRGFTADLSVDEDGLVFDYKDTFVRVWPR